ncbi:FAD-dependent oxidoreductase [Halovenus rubra]|uniref:FAD-dependent oxidoreductase n=2 Tax=Halovenus rubra TaxID=869890 RepID=A0ABD5X8Z2_9EURY|nr:FAD-dependent oxidoreductase [Halovenus rubra]
MSPKTHDVVVVGGGPAGCSAGVFTARYGLQTLIYDRGRSSIQRCAHLENYLGFPAGIDIETFYDLIHDHANESGCEIRSDMVTSIKRAENDDGFIVEPQEGDNVIAKRVIAATRYSGEYLRPLGGAEMFETHEHGGEEHEHFDHDYPDDDGRTPIENLYVATPSDDDVQAIVAAGHGGQVARRLIHDVRLATGFPEEFTEHHDWVRRQAELDEEWEDRDRWREFFDERVPEDHDFDPDTLTEIREAEIDRRLGTYVETEAIERRKEQAQKRLLDHIDDELIREHAEKLDAPEAIE